MYTRNLLSVLDKLLLKFPGVVVLGVRQSGKSVLSRACRPDWEYFDLQRPKDKALILNDPELFFRHHPGQVILDEAQLFPEVLEILRGIIDENREQRNRFIITGSSSPALLSSASETLAGRVAVIELSPLKMNEFCNEPLPLLYRAFESRVSSATLLELSELRPLRTYEEFMRTWLWGGFPEPLARGEEDFIPLWHENYVRTYVERDLKFFFPGLESESFRRFLFILRDFHAGSLNIADISRSLGLGETTVRRYLDIANHTLLWRKLESYERTKLRSTVKNPRGLYRDSGLFHFLSSILSLPDLERSRYRGASFEAFAIEEILRGIEASLTFNTHASFFRTRGGAEVDLIIEGSFGTIPIEIKASSVTTSKDIPSLLSFIEREELPLGLVINLGDTVTRITPKVLSIPITCI
jgi:uncharacterized protein